MSELRPCPFCGGEAHVMAQHWDDGSHVWWVECRACGAEAKRCDDGLEAIDAWNTRAERTCKQEERGWGTEGDHARVWLTCGHDCMVPTVQDLPNYCPNCGAKVVE